MKNFLGDLLRRGLFLPDRAVGNGLRGGQDDVLAPGRDQVQFDGHAGSKRRPRRQTDANPEDPAGRVADRGDLIDPAGEGASGKAISADERRLPHRQPRHVALVDIGGGTTDIAVVSQGGLVGTKMFALGGRAFTKRISSVLGESFLEAETDKLDYSSGKVADTKKAKITKAINEDAEVWLSGVQLTLEEFDKVDLLPSRILLCGGGSNLPDIERVLNEAKWGRDVPFAKRPSVNFLKPKNIASVVDATEELKGVEDVTPMALANLAIDMVGEEKVVDGILSKVIGTIRS